jgi:hypothetical protein
VTLAELIERVEKLEGPDRETDFVIAKACGLIVRSEKTWGNGDTTQVVIDPNHKGRGKGNVRGNVTASLDAAIALTERVLPGWFWRAGRTSLFPKGWAYVSRTHPSHCDRKDEASSSDGKAASPAIALLLATLRALSAQERDDGR